MRGKSRMQRTLNNALFFDGEKEDCSKEIAQIIIRIENLEKKIDIAYLLTALTNQFGSSLARRLLRKAGIAV